MSTPTTETEIASPTPTGPPAPVQPAFHFFKKVQINMPLFVNHQRVPFEALDQNIGVLKLTNTTEQQVLIGALRATAAARRGGVIVITESDYEELKKKWPLKPSVPKPRSDVRIFRKTLPRRAPNANPAAGAANVAGKPNTTSVAGVVGAAAVGGGEAPAGSGASTTPALGRRLRGTALRIPTIKRLVEEARR